jgi:retron-type reverse transcriptase
MKRVGNLWPRLVSWDNLLLAHHQSRRGKRGRPEVARFERDLEPELIALQRELEAGEYRHGPYRLRTITEPKTRVIAASPYRDRVVHHALCQVIEPVVARGFVHDSYACRAGKGTHRALDRYRAHARRFPFLLQGDVQQFFPSVDHEVLLGLIARKLKDRRVLALCAEILGSYDSGRAPRYAPGDDLLAVVDRRVGLPIGNLTSQLFANVMLDPLDHLLQETLRLPGYVRYCDDFCAFAGDKPQLWEAKAAAREHLRSLRLRLHEQKTVVRLAAEPVRFLGFVLRSDGRVRVARQSVHRFRRRLAALRRRPPFSAAGKARAEAAVQGWLAHARYAQSRRLVASLLPAVVREGSGEQFPATG